MCGIAGLIDFAGDARRYKNTYQDMLHLLRRRGPDDSGSYLSPHACLLHTRLAVIDIENGKQPMREQLGDDEMVLVYNGELYNTAELRRDLALLGHKFRGHSDTEVLLRAYIEWGEGCLERLNGIYAFAVWDGKEQTLFAARDRMGVKPFFYSVVGGQLIFASEIKALLCHPLVRPEIDRQGVAELLLLGPGRTPGAGVFRQIEELKPGHCATFASAGGLQVKPYWRLRAGEHRESFDETVETVRFLVRDAIERQTVSDVPLCAFLSGGLDSSAICTLSGVKQTFSVDYVENEKYFKTSLYQPNSDQAYIGQMVNFLGTKHTNVIIQTDELVDALFEAVEARDLPGMADVDSSLLLFCRAVKEHATVALSGECADELFGGYPWYRDDKILNHDGFPWSQSTDYRASFARKGLWEGFDPALYVRQKYEGTLSDTGTRGDESGTDRRIRQMYRLNTDWFMQTLLDRKDRMSMYSGLEVRVPFCDHRLAEYLYNVPWAFKNDGGREKGLLREALRGVLPEEVLWRKKSPYPKTHHPDYLKKVSAVLRDVVHSPGSPVLDIVDRESLKRLLVSAHDDTPWYGQLMTVPQTIAYFIQLNAWMEKYRVRLV